jgi:hypothetical protein
VVNTIQPRRVVWAHGRKQPKWRESHYCRVVVAKVRRHPKGGLLDRLVPTKTPVHEAQVELVGVVRVRWYNDDHPATWNAQALKLGHLVGRWGGVASGAVCFPRKAWTNLLLQSIGTVNVVLVEQRKSHLYKRRNTCQVSKESNMSNGAILVSVNKNS